MVLLKNLYEIKKTTKACNLVGNVLKKIKKEIKANISTLELDSIAESLILEGGGIPAFKNYNGFKHTICASINEEAVHGIPSNRLLKNGDIVSIDLGANIDGFFGDAAFTCGVGKINKKAEKIVTTTKECLYNAISCCTDNNRTSYIGQIIEVTAKKNGYNVVRDYGGHGVGRKLHEEPFIFNYKIANIMSSLLKTGMIIAIEPILSEGSGQVGVLKDGWTVKSSENKLTAHFEHTILITNREAVVLTEN